MADDLTDAEASVQAMQGIDNHPVGFALARVVRQLRAARQKFAAIDDRIAAANDRIAALEARVTNLGG